jgi:hypothetical protein
VNLKTPSVFVYDTVEPGYNDIGLSSTSSVASDMVLPTTAYSSVLATLVYNHTKLSVPFMTFEGIDCIRCFVKNVEISEYLWWLEN